MIRGLRGAHPRRMVLGVIAATIVVGFFLVQSFVLPAYDEWRLLGSRLKAQAEEYESLASNLAIRTSVDAELKKLGPHAEQSASDQITLSQFLRDIETQAHQPSMTVINMKPLPVRDEGTHKRYPVRLAVAGKLQEVLQFVSDILNRDVVAGLDAFSIRGVQGSNMVECTLSVWMVTLVDHSSPNDARTKVVTRSVRGGSKGE